MCIVVVLVDEGENLFFYFIVIDLVKFFGLLIFVFCVSVVWYVSSCIGIVCKIGDNGL